MTDRLKVWITAIRVPFFTATIVPVIFGTALAWYDKDIFLLSRFVWTMIGAIFVHAGTNLANDYFDYRSGCDAANKTPTQFSGGSRVIQKGLIAPEKILYAAVIFFVFGGTIGLYLNYLCKTNVILILGVIGVFLGVFYTAAPIHIGYRSFGELAVGLGFGPLMVMGSYYVEAQTLPFNIFLASIPIGILIALVVYINEFPDYEADKSVNKRTLVVILGKKKAVLLYNILLALVYVIAALLVFFKMLPVFCLIVFLSLPLAGKAFFVSKKNYDKIYELLPANASTIALHLAVGILLCVGTILDRIFL